MTLEDRYILTLESEYISETYSLHYSRVFLRVGKNNGSPSSTRLALSL